MTTVQNNSAVAIPIGPSDRLSITQELLWTPIDFGLLCLSPEFKGRGIPHGNGAAVITIPGFLGSRAYLLYQVFEFWCRRIDYTSYPCGLGLNIGCPNDSARVICNQIDKAVEETGMQVHLVGHSLGAALARSAAKRQPGKVASVTSVAGTIQGALVHPLVYSLTRLMMPSKCMENCFCYFHRSLEDRTPPNVPRLALYTPDDGVIEPWNCQEVSGGRNVEIKGSTHVGLMTNRYSYRAIAKFLDENRAQKLTTATLAIA